MSFPIRSCLWLIGLLGLLNPISWSEDLEYNRDIRPILANNCFACHGPDSASRKADLRLDQRDAAIELKAIAPGKPEKSEIIARIFSDDEFSVMPPPETKKSLSAEEKAKLKQWVAQGAEYQPHWSLLPPQQAELPKVKHKGWAKNPIDHFVLAALEKQKLSPAPEADARTLFRRLHLDITGLPPKPQDTSKFVSDYQQHGDQALSNWIDRLMATPDWGEHRARYWLDAARYGDTHGLHFDNYREMYPYRDWVIKAFNQNQPFDQFTIEQLAGDLLPEPTIDQLVATGFQRCNITTNEGGTIDAENLALYASDRVQTFGWVYLGLTTNCAQCHDHKFDPITMKDYYALAAFFRNTTQGAKDGNVKDGRGPSLVVPSEEDRPRWNALPEEISVAKSKRDAYRKQARAAFDKWLATATPSLLDKGISTESLQVYAPLNEGSGSEVKNLAETSETIGATGEITWQQDGKLGPAPVMKLGSTFELGKLGDFEKNQAFSYGAWINAGDNSTNGGIIARMDEQGDYRGWDLWQQGPKVAAHFVDHWPDNALKVATRNNVLKPGQWQHVFVTYDGSGKPNGVKIYIDGKAQPTRPETNTLKPNASLHTETPLRIGQRSHTQAFQGGSIQDVRIYSRLLNAGEIQSLANHAVLRTILALPTKKRNEKQKNELYTFYLNNVDAEFPALEQVVAKLEAEQNAIRGRSPITHIQQERKNSQAMAHILERGQYDMPGEKVAASPPAALHPMPEGAPLNRLGLAQWVVDPANPLTTRVTVNRFWQQIFGRGLVVTTEDFGVMGAQPSHQDLLDWLAVEFRKNDWDVKRFFKLMLMSATYRQAAVTTPEKLEQDGKNILLSRGPRFRMDAEMIRDCALAASGLLSDKMYGPGVKPYQPSKIWDMVGLPGGDTRNYSQSQGEDLYRRSLYNFWKRMAPPPNLEAFNAPSREVCVVRRERTNTPLQALVTLNDPTFIEAARHLAQNALGETAGDDAQTIDFIAQRVLSRSMSEEEIAILLSNKDEFLTYYESQPAEAQKLISVGESKANEKIDVSKLAAWTMLCNQVLNLDETLNK